MQRFFARIPLRALAAAALLLSSAVPALAAKAVVDVTSQGTLSYYLANGNFDTAGNDAIGPLTDGDLDTGVVRSEWGSWFVLDFSEALGTDQLMYVRDIEVGVAATRRYSIYVSEDGTSYVPVPDATNVTASGTTLYSVRTRVRTVKYVFVEGTSSTQETKTLSEFHVKGFVSSKPDIVSNYKIASFHNADGTAMTANGGGGNNWGGAERSAQRMFDNDFTSYQMWPKAGQNGYVMVDFTSTNGPAHLSAYYVTELWVGANGTKKFTLQYSEDGSTWENVDGATAVTCEGIGKFAVGKIAKAVRYVWTDGSYNNFNDEYLAEFQAWGMNPEDAPCTHPTYTAWEETVPATCTERAMLTRKCTRCGETFAKNSDGLPLGHSYVTTLDRSGLFSRQLDFPDHRRYGTGSITCSNCNFRLDFPTAIDLVTNRINGTKICGVKTEGIVRFTDLTPSSENNPQWGPSVKKLIDEIWNTTQQEWPYWTTTSTNAQYADFVFGTTVDLTEIEFSVYNHGYHLDFCSVDEEEEETKFGEIDVVKDEELETDYQRIRVPFFETPVKHLRVRILDEEPIDLWGCRGLRVIEIHPWGTVPGASDYLADKGTLIIFR